MGTHTRTHQHSHIGEQWHHTPDSRKLTTKYLCEFLRNVYKTIQCSIIYRTKTGSKNNVHQQENEHIN